MVITYMKLKISNGLKLNLSKVSFSNTEAEQFIQSFL